jgi:hypothetical protein
MKKFLIKCILWFCGLLLTVVTIVLIVINIYHNDYYNLTKKANKKTFLLSDSHGLQINLDIISANNLSYASNSYVDIKNQLSWLIKNKRVDTVLLTYDEHMFSSYRDNYNNNYLSYFYNPKNITEFKISFLADPLNLFEKLIDNKFKGFFIKKTNNLNKSEPRLFSDLGKQEQINRAKNRITVQFKEESITQKNAFNDILDICNINNIELILIKFPLSQIYINERNKNEAYKYLKKTNNNYRVLDFSNSIPDIKSYFDQDHLNEEGINIFEKLIASSINKQ